jgi:glycosyltransferase involved in cell wall biosynthesis
MLDLAMPQPGAHWPAPLKPFAVPLRLWAAITVARRIHELQPDLVHVHWAPNGLAAALSGLPYVLHAHGDDVRDRRGPYRLFTKWLLKRAHLVLYSTPDLQGAVDGVWLPNPVSQVSGQTPQTASVLMASRAESSKGREVAVAAASRLTGSLSVDALIGPDVVGQRNIRAVPEMSHDRFRTALAEYSVVWGQFKLGALGLTELEAMSAGRVVVCWVSDEVAEAYGGRIPVISTRDPDTIARETRRLLLDSGARAELGSAARAFVEAWHGPSHIGKRLAELYWSLV